MSSDSVSDSSGPSTPASGLRIGFATRGVAVEFFFDGTTVSGYAGESVACALFAAGIRTLRRSARTASVRGMFCLMGSCQECVVEADGRRVAACQEPVRAGLAVRSVAQDGTR